MPFSKRSSVTDVLFTSGTSSKMRSLGTPRMRAKKARIAMPWHATATVFPSFARAMSVMAASMRFCTAVCASLPGTCQRSGSWRNARFSSGDSRFTSPQGRISHAPKHISMSRLSAKTGMSRPPTMAAAVSSARRRGLVYTAASGVSAKRFVRYGSCALPSAVSSTSVCPCTRRKRLPSDCPWRTRNIWVMYCHSFGNGV